MPAPDQPQTVEALLQVIETLNETIGSQRRELKRLVRMVEGLTAQLDELLRDRDDERRAELKRLQQEADAAAARAAASEGAEESPTPPEEGKNKPKGNRHEHGRSPIPPELERDTHKVRPDQCSACGADDLLVADTLVTEEYDYVRAHIRVRRTERTACRCAKCDARVTPPQPPMPFDRAACTFGLMSWMLFTRCGLFIPLDRLLADLRRQGAAIPSSTATRWWNRGADLLLPVAESVRLSLLAGDHIRTDGTGLRVIYPRKKANPKKGQPREGEVDDDGYLVTPGATNGQILVFGDDRHAVFLFTPNKEGHHAMDFLEMGEDERGEPIYWRGTITADALSAHDCLFADGDRTESGCNAHGLRKFRDDQDKAPLLASRAMAFIGRIYDIETEARAKELTGPDLLAHRKAHAKPVVDQFGAWLTEHLTDLLPSNPVRKAMQYYKNHWKALTRFLHDAAVPLDNNWSERALRKVALFRKNSLFAGGEEGAQRLCTVLTLIQTCRLIGVDPCAYIEWALERVVPHPDNRGLRPADLTPAAYRVALG